MLGVALKGLEWAMNQAIRLDVNAMQQLEALSGKVIQVDISDWDIQFFILPHRGGLQLLSRVEGEPDTLIAGKCFGLMKTAIAKARTTVLFDESISISGDTATGEALRDILRGLDIDWEEQLSRVVGDTLAHPIAHCAQQTVELGKQGLRSLGENVSEYLHYESQQLPTRQSVDAFIKAVDRLRNDVDRMAVRIERIQSSASSQTE